MKEGISRLGLEVTTFSPFRGKFGDKWVVEHVPW